MWDNDKVQFARLLCEIVAANKKLSLMEVSESMDLDVGSVHEILDRAHDVWEKSKQRPALSAMKQHLSALLHRSRCNRDVLLPMLDQLSQPQLDALWRMIQNIQEDAERTGAHRFARKF